ncbi:MAG: hypothetical protein K0Q47_1720 [Sedimentibacter sp.]|jgi:uncharacterized membrane protein YgaE (UPF0421/DUF939 family)|nr:hypothetical protein [Sedimentibacter sp.]
MIKKSILPVLLGVAAFFAAPFISPEIEGAATFFLVALGIGLGIMLDTFIFKKKSNNTSTEKSEIKN